MSSAAANKSPDYSTPAKESLGRRCLLLALLGLIDSLYLTYHTISVRGGYQTGQSACNLGGAFNCDHVAASPYAELLGHPVAAFGAAYYLIWLFFLSLGRKLTEREGQSGPFNDLLFFWAAAGLPAVLYLGGASAILGFYCLFCILLYLVGLVLAFVCWKSDRSRGALQRLGSGAAQALHVLLPGRSGALSAAAWLVIAVAALVAFGSGPALTEYYFEPRRIKLADRAHLQPFIAAWEKAARVELPVNDSEDPLSRDFSLGSEDAEITLVEFSDFQCPACKRASKHFKELVRIFPGQVRVVFKNYPLDSGCNPAMEHSHHDFACQASLMARCAGLHGQEKFWQMHDALFALDQFDWSMERLLELPKEIGLPAERFDQCLSEPRTRQRLDEDIELGNRIRLEGTPSVFVHGKKLSFSQLEQLPGLLRIILQEYDPPV